MFRAIFMKILVVWASYGVAQQPYFLDSLFTHDFSEFENYESDFLTAKRIEAKKDLGFSVRAAISNNYPDEISRQQSTRILASANLLRGGLIESRMKAQSIDSEMKLNELRGLETSINHNYGIYYDYVIYAFNIFKIRLSERISTFSNSFLDQLKELYYSKVIDYHEVYKVKKVIDEQDILKSSHSSYNAMFDSIIGDHQLQILSGPDIWNVDFEGIRNHVVNDTLNDKILGEEERMVNLKYDQRNLPSLSGSIGYDITRQSPYWSIQFAKKLNFKSKSTKKKEISRLHRLSELRIIQKQKELLNIQYEYDYKLKQIQGLEHTLESLKEQLRRNSARTNILGLEESIESKEIQLESLLVEYEIMTIRQQLMLLLLNVKKVAWPIQLKSFLSPVPQTESIQKFAGTRYIFLKDENQLTVAESEFILQNELVIISDIEPVLSEDWKQINPSEFESRKEFEIRIEKIVSDSTDCKILISDLKEFMDLDIRTISYGHNQSVSLLNQ